MSVLFSVVEGRTKAMGPFTLKLNGVLVDLTGFTITLILRTPSGTLITVTGTVDLLNQTTAKGQFTFTPGANDFTFIPGGYTLNTLCPGHWKVVDGAGDIVHFPDEEPFEVAVYRA